MARRGELGNEITYVCLYLFEDKESKRCTMNICIQISVCSWKGFGIGKCNPNRNKVINRVQRRNCICAQILKLFCGRPHGPPPPFRGVPFPGPHGRARAWRFASREARGAAAVRPERKSYEQKTRLSRRGRERERAEIKKVADYRGTKYREKYDRVRNCLLVSLVHSATFCNLHMHCQYFNNLSTWQLPIDLLYTKN